MVDIDTLWRDRATGDESNHWLGRTCKVYALVAGEWTMTMQTGALNESRFKSTPQGRAA